jgi:hypothetical protein
VGSRHALIAPSTTATLAFAASVDVHPRARPCMRPWVEANGYGGPHSRGHHTVVVGELVTHLTAASRTHAPPSTGSLLEGDLGRMGLRSGGASNPVGNYDANWLRASRPLLGTPRSTHPRARLPLRRSGRRDGAASTSRSSRRRPTKLVSSRARSIGRPVTLARAMGAGASAPYARVNGSRLGSKQPIRALSRRGWAFDRLLSPRQAAPRRPGPCSSRRR